MRSKLEPGIEFQYSGRLLSERGSSNISAEYRFRYLIEVLKIVFHQQNGQSWSRFIMHC